MTIVEKLKSFPELLKVFTKMFNVVGADTHSFNISDKDWFENCQWTEKERGEFEKWLTNEIYNNKQLREEIHIAKDKKRIKAAVTWFLLNHGWKIKK